MACTHVAKLGSRYPGLFCIYCGQRCAELGAGDGQVFLRRDDERRYIAVIFRGKQKVVREIDDQADPVVLRFRDDDEAEVSAHELLMAFQSPEEVWRDAAGEA